MPETDAIEQQIAALQQQLAEKKASLEQQGVKPHEMPSDREIVHDAIGEQIQSQIPSYAPAPAVPPSSDSSAQAGDTPSYLDPQLQPHVQDLLNIAFISGLEPAIKALGQLHNDALTDAFHDAITDEFIKQLTESGKVPKLQE